jgi:hypothetical protein
MGVLTGCPMPQTSGTPPVETSPTPTPSSAPEQTLDAFDVTVRELDLDANGQLRLEVDAPDALVVLPLIAPQGYFIRMDEAPEDALPAYRTAARSLLAPAPAFRGNARGLQAVRSMEAAGGYGAEATFRVGEATITAQRVVDGEHCLVYVDTRDAAGAEAKLQQIGAAFDAMLYPKATQLLGTEPGGREEDGFNRGDDRIVLLMSSETAGPDASFDPTDLFPGDVDVLSNYGKILHLSAETPVEQLLPSLAEALGGLIFGMQRLETYSRMTGDNLPAGQDPTYLFDEEAGADRWLVPLMSQLTRLACGYTPEAGDRDALMAIGKYLELPGMFRLDTPSLYQAYDSNAGQMLLFSAYLHGLKPDFAQGLGSVQALGTEALAEALQKDFSTLYRDFSLATVLDGLAGVPARYTIPFVDLHHAYTVDGKPFPFAGAGAPTAGLVGGNASFQTIMLRSNLPQGKLRLGLSAGIAKKATLVLFRPSTTARFIEE